MDTCTKDCLFSAEYHSGQLALRDRTGAYLSPIGSKAVLKTRSQTVTKDELFSLEDSLPQASFVAALNNKFVSVKQGKRGSLLAGSTVVKAGRLTHSCGTTGSLRNSSLLGGVNKQVAGFMRVVECCKQLMEGIDRKKKVAFVLLL